MPIYFQSPHSCSPDLDSNVFSGMQKMKLFIEKSCDGIHTETIVRIPETEFSDTCESEISVPGILTIEISKHGAGSVSHYSDSW